MLKSTTRRRTGLLLSLLSLALAAQPAAAAQDRTGRDEGETRRAAFAGAAFRLELGGQARRPSTRLQLGVRSVAGDPHAAAAASDPRHVPLVELGVGSRESGSLFVAGQSTAEIERRLALSGGETGTVAVVFGVALLVVGVIVITSLDGLSED